MSTHSTTHNTMLAAALTYAKRGWHVIPLAPESKRPARPDHTAGNCAGTDPWCRDGHTGWEQRATCDPARITRAWSSRPDYGIGIATGPSGLIVVDLDMPKDGETAPEPFASDGAACGWDVLALLADAHQARFPETYTVRTPTGGHHLYFRRPTGGPVYGNTASSLGWLVDTRARGGQVVAPPTTIAGHSYQLIDWRVPAPLPGWIDGLLLDRQHQSRPGTAGGPHNGSQRVSGAPAGPGGGWTARNPAGYVAAALEGEARKVATTLTNRNHALFEASIALGQLVAGGALAEHTAHDVLIGAAAVHFGVRDFTRSEAEATIASGLSKGANNPRTPNPRNAA